MLKVRVMPTLLFKRVGLVKGIRFDSWRRVGHALQTVKVYNLREVDELIFLDILATLENRRPDFETVDDLADECFMPMTVGGGVRDLDDIKKLLKVGADKVAINTVAVENPEFIREASQKFGSQCIVVSMDVKKEDDGTYRVYTHAGTKRTNKEPVSFAKEVERLGAGEILLTSIDRDGTMLGYDIELTKAVSTAVSIPVIASGGAGQFEHFLEALEEGKAAAVAAASLYHFTEMTPLMVKQYLKEQSVNVRV